MKPPGKWEERRSSLRKKKLKEARKQPGPGQSLPNSCPDKCESKSTHGQALHSSIPCPQTPLLAWFPPLRKLRYYTYCSQNEWTPTTLTFWASCLHACSVTKPCLTPCDPMDCNPLGSSVHGISQSRILEWIAISSSRGSSWPRNWTHISCITCIGKQILYHCVTWESHPPPTAPHLLNFLSITGSQFKSPDAASCPGTCGCVLAAEKAGTMSSQYL